MRNVRVGDIVFRKDETAAGQTYKHARVVKVHVGIDGRVRSADIEYRLPGEKVYRTTTRPIHKLVMIIPVEEQTEGSSEEETRITKPDRQEPVAVEKTVKQKKQNQTSLRRQKASQRTTHRARERSEENQPKRSSIKK
jgi:hypothetical protein